MAGQFTLGKEERLKSRKAIELLFSKGKRLSSGQVRVVYTPIAEPQLRLGVTVSNRSFPKAVDRNRIRRLLREAYRLQKLPLYNRLKAQGKGLNLFLIYSGTTMPLFPEIQSSVAHLLAKLSEIL